MSKQMVELRADACTTAADIQTVINRMAKCGGVVRLPEMELTLDRGLEIPSGVELCGRGDRTILRKGPSRVYPLSGYHNYGMQDIPLQSTEGLEVGMTVSVLSDKCRGFYSTFARITWVDDTWVGLDHGIESDYSAEDNPRLVTAYPLVFGHGIRNAALRDVSLDGNLEQNPDAMDGCRGGAVYFANSDGIDISGVRESRFNGEGLSFQMCTRMTISDSSFGENAGNGLHPGAGSTHVLFRNCRAQGNRRGGFFFCVRANHITVRDSVFSGNNGPGMSVGARDCYNLIEGCEMTGNGEAGILVRHTDAPIEVHSCAVRRCHLADNVGAPGRGQIELQGDARDIIIEKTILNGGGRTAGIVTTDNVQNVFLSENQYAECKADAIGAGFGTTRPVFECGHESARPSDARHLGCRVAWEEDDADDRDA